jgi:hypothetical protein
MSRQILGRVFHREPQDRIADEIYHIGSREPDEEF